MCREQITLQPRYIDIQERCNPHYRHDAFFKEHHSIAVPCASKPDFSISLRHTCSFPVASVEAAVGNMLFMAFLLCGARKTRVNCAVN